MAPAIALGMLDQAFACALQVNATARKTYALFAAEWQDFVGRRLSQDISLVRRVATCKSPGQVWSSYVEFWQQAADDYGREFATIARLTGECLNDGPAPLPQSRKESEAEGPRRAA